ncbi:alpha/beta fold hydrolase [Actinosynnema sp. NPDC059797]
MSSRPGLAAGLRRVATGLAVVLLVFTAAPASGSPAGSGHRPKPTVVLVGHSYGGVVITNAATGNANVKALVYAAAFAPDAGDTVGGLQVRFPGTKLGPSALDVREFPRAGGGVGHEGYVKPALFRDVFAGDLPAATVDLIVDAATNR